MNRKNIYEDGIFIGWFCEDSAEEIASYKKGDCYINGKILYATANGKLVVNVWNNSGNDYYKFADNESEICEILTRSGYNDDDKRLVDILKKYEI